VFLCVCLCVCVCVCVCLCVTEPMALHTNSDMRPLDEKREQVTGNTSNKEGTQAGNIAGNTGNTAGNSSNTEGTQAGNTAGNTGNTAGNSSNTERTQGTQGTQTGNTNKSREHREHKQGTQGTQAGNTGNTSREQNVTYVAAHLRTHTQACGRWTVRRCRCRECQHRSAAIGNL
jgi:hypothetical protein